MEHHHHHDRSSRQEKFNEDLSGVIYKNEASLALVNDKVNQTETTLSVIPLDDYKVYEEAEDCCTITEEIYISNSVLV